MPNIDPALANIGALGIIALFTIKELFSWLKNKKNNGVDYPTKIECELKHGYLNQNISDIKQSIDKIKNNELVHMEADIVQIKLDMIEIKTILNERLPLGK